MRYVSAREMMNVFHISRTTLNRWKNDGYVNYQQLTPRKIIYDIDSVIIKTNNIIREKKTVLYFRITPKEQNKISNIVSNVRKYASTNNFVLDDVYVDIITNRSKNRPAYKRLIEDINKKEIGTICVLNEHNMSYSDFEYFEKIFSYFETKIVNLNFK